MVGSTFFLVSILLIACDTTLAIFSLPQTFIFTLHYIAFPGSRVSQNDCRMWNMSSKPDGISKATEGLIERQLLSSVTPETGPELS